MQNEQLLENLRDMLQDVLRARFEGTQYAKLARAHGYADGYMRALLDADLVDKSELLRLVGNERRRYIEQDDARQAAQARQAEQARQADESGQRVAHGAGESGPRVAGHTDAA
jgi:hypothetical protein